MGLLRTIKRSIRRFLDIEEVANVYDVDNIYTNFDEFTTIKKNKIWYRNNPYELQDFWHKVACNSNWFWHKVPHNEDIIQNADDLKVNMVNIPADVISKMLNEIEVKQDVWQELSKNIDFRKLVNEATKKSLITKKCAFKVIADTNFSEYPFIETVDAEYFTEKKKYGKTIEYTFYTKLQDGDRDYVLEENYGCGYITYCLKDEDDREVPIDTLEETRDLKDIYFDKRLILATTYAALGYNPNGEGISVYDGKDSSLMVLDEVVSVINQEIRNGRSTVYHPMAELEYNESGKKKRPNPFENHRSYYLEDMTQDAKNEIKLVQPLIRSNELEIIKNDCINDVLQGRFSPATLGIDVKKMDNATAQREKEKTSQYTFNIMSDNLQDALKDIIFKLVNCYNVIFRNSSYVDEIEISINISEYNSPSFSDKIETIIPLYTNKVLSREDILNEIFGDNKTKKEKQDMLKRAEEEFESSKLEQYLQIPKFKKGAEVKNKQLPFISDKEKIEREREENLNMLVNASRN